MEAAMAHHAHHDAIKEHMTVVSADGAHVGTVDKLDGERIKLTKNDSGSGEHRWLAAGLVAEIEGETVRLSTSSANVGSFIERE